MIDPYALIETYGLDQTRYFLMRDVPFGNDGDFSKQSMINRMNAELANDVGNLCQRSLSMIAKNCGAAVPDHGAFEAADQALLDKAAALLETCRTHVDAQAFHRMLEAVFEVVGDANRYVDEMAPWALRKTDPDRMATVLYTLAETIRHVAILLQPVVPDSAAKILDQLAISDEHRSFKAVQSDFALKPGTPLPKPEGVFPRFVEEAAS